MPKENINRAINKSETGNGENFENLRYEGFGPKKVVLIIEALTDNKNRTASGIRTILQKYGGNLGASGSTAHFFNNCGVIQISKENTPDEKILNFAAKAGAKDCFSYDIFHEIITKKEDFYRIKNQAEKLFSKITYSNIEWRPLNQVELKKIEKEEIESMLELLEQNDDVQNVFHNFKVV